MRGLSPISGRAARPSLLLVAAAVCALLVAAADGRASSATAAANTATFQDSTGEDPAGPDIASIVVSNDDKGLLTFATRVPNRPTLTGDMLFLLAIDSDANPASGSADFLGADYIIELDGPLTGPAGVALFRWNGTDFTASGVPQLTLVFSYANGPTITINSSELGSTRRFNFGVIAVTGVVLGPDGQPNLDNIKLDFAPDAGRGFYPYEVKLTPPSLRVQSAGTRPARPRAGRAFSAFAVVARSDGTALQGGRVSCRATVAGRALRPTASGMAGARATCAFRAPATAKGKTIRITIVVTAQGLRATRTLSARVA